MSPNNQQELIDRIHDLEQRLAESEETLAAIRSGEVDAVVGSGPEGDRIYTLRGADEAYRVMIEDMAEGAATLAPDGLILFSNERFAAMVGLSLEHVIGFPLQHFVASEDGDILAAMLAQDRHPAKSEIRLRTVGGSMVPAYLSSNVLRQDGLDCLCVIFTDLTEQKRNEDIVAAEKLARSILEQAAEAIIVVDRTGRIIRASRAASGLAGMPVLLRDFDDVFQVRLGSGLREYPFHQIISTIHQRSTLNRIEATAITRYGAVVDVLLSAALLSDDDGQLVGYILTMTDITERKRSEAALRESQLRYSTMAETVSGILFTHRSDGYWDYVSNRFYEYTGLPLGSAEGSRWTIAVHPEDLRVSRPLWDASIRQGKPYEAEYRLLRRDGEYRWFRARVEPLRRDGIVSEWFGVSVDVHDQKALQGQLERRTQDLERSNDELQRFAYVISHDLQSPLRTIASMTQLLGTQYKGMLDDRADELISFVQAGVKRMSRLIADLLDYSRLSKDGQKPSRAIDSGSLLNWAMMNLHAQIVESGAQIVIDEPLPQAMVDEQLARVFQNLIGNAIKYRSREQPEIHIRAECSSDIATFALRDNGIGLDMKYADRIFGVFQRLHTADQYEGTGIGLAVSKKIIERYGGHIWVESAVGEGATFYFTVPVSLQDETESQPVRSTRAR